MIPFNRATLGSLEYEYLSRAINNYHISGAGPFTRQAEKMLAGLHGSGQSLLTTSCTHALELAARLANLGPGDEVIVPSFTFVSTAAAFLTTGANVMFADVRPDTLNICPLHVESLITERTKAVCIVHYAGVGADPSVFQDLCKRYGLILIEDNAHGFGGNFAGTPLGTYGDFSALSFHETKNITCGEGGAIHINNQDFVSRAEILREKGTNRARFFRGEVDKYTWVDVGSSWVVSDLLAAILTAQLEQLNEIQQRRMHIWSEYQTCLVDWAESQGVRTPVIPSGAEHPAHMFYLRMKSLGSRTKFIDHMRRLGVSTVFHYQALHLSEVGQRLGGRKGQCPESEMASDDLVRLPLFVGMTDQDVDSVIKAATAFQKD